MSTGVGLKKKKKSVRPHSFFQQLLAFTSLMSPRRTLATLMSLTEAQQTSSPALSQLCTLVSGVAQNFATSCELIRHIFSGFWEDRRRVMSLHHPTQRRPCTTVPLHSEHIWQMPILQLSLITVNERTYFGRFQYLYRLHTLWRPFYSQDQAEGTRVG